jgi:hypothetical protein
MIIRFIFPTEGGFILFEGAPDFSGFVQVFQTAKL